MEITLSVAIPSYNERPTIMDLVSTVARQKPLVRQIIVVDDGSTDGSPDILDLLQLEWKHPDIELKVIRLPINQGKGAAVRAALEAASQPYFLIQDGDLELDPADYGKLLEPILQKKADVVFGNRFGNGFPADLPRLSKLANLLVTTLSNWLYGLHLHDQACGYKLLPTALARDLKLKSNRFEICSEMTAKLGRRHLRIANIPVWYKHREMIHGKKIRWWDGFISVYTLWRS